MQNRYNIYHNGTYTDTIFADSVITMLDSLGNPEAIVFSDTGNHVCTINIKSGYTFTKQY